MKTWVDEYLSMVKDCERRDTMLSDWERSFVDSIRHRLNDTRPLTAKQTETLDRIWGRVTG